MNESLIFWSVIVVLSRPHEIMEEPEDGYPIVHVLSVALLPLEAWEQIVEALEPIPFRA